jgi:UDP-glucuronate 4-epimerase
MQRDFTCIDDIVEGVVRVTNKIPASEDNWSGDHPNPATSKAPYRIYNIGNHEPVKLLYFIEVLEKALGWETQKEFLPIQPGDIPATDASVEALEKDVSFRPNTPHWSGD